MKKKIFAFGEVMLRIYTTDRGERITDAKEFCIEPGGSESNVAVALSHLGNSSALVSGLPSDNPLTEKIKAYLRYHNVDTSMISERQGRLGIYWSENGIGHRNSFIVYDRKNSVFSKISINDINWTEIKKSAGWFHLSGISPAVSEQVAETVKRLLVRLGDVHISIDLNYRSKLWQWVKGRPRAGFIKKYMDNICSHATMIVGNETDFSDSLGYLDAGSPDEYLKIAQDMFGRLKKLRYIGVSIRGSVSASENGWSGLFFVKSAKKVVGFSGTKFCLTNIVDRVGSGDSFTAGLIHGIINKYPFQKVVDFAVSLGALKHTVTGDASVFKVTDVEHLIKTKGSGKIVR